MKTFVVDWGEGCAGGRYGLVQESSIEWAYWAADRIADPVAMAELKIPHDDEYDIRYLEVDAPGEPFAGVALEKLGWKSGGELYGKAVKELVNASGKGGGG